MIPTPGYSGNRIKLTPKGYLITGLSALFIVLAIVLYVYQFSHFGKMLDTKYFLLLSFILGIVIGILIALKFATNEKDSFERMKMYVVCIMISIVFMPLVVSLVNRFLDFKEPQEKTVQLLELEGIANQPYGHLKGEEVKITRFETTFLMDEEVITLYSKTSPFSKDQIGEMVKIPVSQGLLGIRYFNF